MAKVYVAGSLQNPNVQRVASRLRTRGHDVFVDWFSGGPEADVHWRLNEIAKGNNMRQALKEDYARHILEFDEKWMEWADAVVVVGPAGKSAHMELIHFVRAGKPGYLYLPEGDLDRWDLMLAWATDIIYDFDELDTELRRIS